MQNKIEAAAMTREGRRDFWDVGLNVLAALAKAE
jgi:hypothetical protein